MMDERLDLTDEQEGRLRSLLEEHADAMRSWREDNDDVEREERRAHMRESMTALRQDVATILTDEQTEKLEAMHERMQDRREDRRDRRDHRKDHRKAEVFEQLGLTDAQKEQLQRLRESNHAEMQAWREANPNATRSDVRERMRARRRAPGCDDGDPHRGPAAAARGAPKQSGGSA